MAGAHEGEAIATAVCFMPPLLLFIESRFSCLLISAYSRLPNG